MEKYYTPEVEEFHVGFEFEVDYNPEDESELAEGCERWDKEEFPESEHMYNVRKLLRETSVRVKYLDQEDIESLGFEEDIESKEGYPTNTEGLYFGKVLLPVVSPTKIRFFIKFHVESQSAHLMCDEERPHSGCQYQVFAGTIKNKSELKKVLKQIGYEF